MKRGMGDRFRDIREGRRGGESGLVVMAPGCGATFRNVPIWAGALLCWRLLARGEWSALVNHSTVALGGDTHRRLGRSWAMMSSGGSVVVYRVRSGSWLGSLDTVQAQPIGSAGPIESWRRSRGGGGLLCSALRGRGHGQIAWVRCGLGPERVVGGG